jgi:hypothetical protein
MKQGLGKFNNYTESRFRNKRILVGGGNWFRIVIIQYLKKLGEQPCVSESVIKNHIVKSEIKLSKETFHHIVLCAMMEMSKEERELFIEDIKYLEKVIKVEENRKSREVKSES